MGCQGAEAGKERGFDGQHWLPLHRWSSYCCEGRFSQNCLDHPCLHRGAGEDCSLQKDRQALEVDRLGSDQKRNPCETNGAGIDIHPYAAPLNISWGEKQFTLKLSAGQEGNHTIACWNAPTRVTCLKYGLPETLLNYAVVHSVKENF